MKKRETIKKKISKDWQIWKKSYLSDKERKSLSLAHFIDFLCAKGYWEYAESKLNKK